MRVKAEVIDNDEVVIRYTGLEDGDGPTDVVLRVRIYEDTADFQLSLEVEADSRIEASLAHAKDINLIFPDIKAPEFDDGCAASCSCQCDREGCDCRDDEDDWGDDWDD